MCKIFVPGVTEEELNSTACISFFRPDDNEVNTDFALQKKPMLRGFAFFKKNGGTIWDEWDDFREKYLNNVPLSPRERELLILAIALSKGCLPCLSDHIQALSVIEGVTLEDVVSVCYLLAIFTTGKKVVMKRIEEVLSKADYLLSEDEDDEQENEKITINLESSLGDVMDNKILLALSLFKCDKELIEKYTSALYGKISKEDYSAIAETVMFIASAFVVPQSGLMNMKLMALDKAVKS